MTAWTVLTGNSTAPAGSDAWTHLNSQSGGGIVMVGGMRTVDLRQELLAHSRQALTASLALPALTMDRAMVLSASIKQIMEASVCQ